MDTSGVQRVERPTRDILVTRKPDGDRQFAGFGKASWWCCSKNNTLCRMKVLPLL